MGDRIAFAPSFRQTRWSEIGLYAMLECIDPSPLHTMRWAVAVAEWQGPDAGLAMLHALAPPAWLADSYFVGRGAEGSPSAREERGDRANGTSTRR